MPMVYWPDPADPVWVCPIHLTPTVVVNGLLRNQPVWVCHACELDAQDKEPKQY